MDDAFLVRVLHGVADLHEHFQPLPDGQVRLVAIPRDRDAVDQFHHEERPAKRRRPRVEHLGDAGVVHQRKRLALLRETRHHLLAVHPQADDFERDLPAHRVLLFGHPHHAETALAQRLDEPESADVFARFLGLEGHEHRLRVQPKSRLAARRIRFCDRRRPAAGNMAIGLTVDFRLHPPPQIRLITARRVQVSGALQAVRFAHRGKEHFLFFGAGNRPLFDHEARSGSMLVG